MCLMRHVAEQYHVLAQPTEKHVGEQVCVLHGEGDVWEVFETDVAAGVLGPAAAAGSTSQVSTLLGGMRMVRAFYRGMISAHKGRCLDGTGVPLTVFVSLSAWSTSVAFHDFHSVILKYTSIKYGAGME